MESNTINFAKLYSKRCMELEEIDVSIFKWRWLEKRCFYRNFSSMVEAHIIENFSANRHVQFIPTAGNTNWTFI
jgi:hypothetical protein